MSAPADRHSIVAGVDESATSLAAARWAARLADRMHKPLVLVHAVGRVTPVYYGGPIAPVPYPDITKEMWAAAQTTVHNACDVIQRTHPNLEVVETVCPGVSDITLVELSDQAAMTVVGSRGDGGAGSLLLGSTALRVADHAHGPVVVWRGDPERPVESDKPVLVGVDGTVAGQGALREAFDIASSLGVGVIALHARVGTDDTSRTASTLLTDRVGLLTAHYPEVKVEEVVCVGNAATALLQQAPAAQLVVVASHVRSRVIASLLGSTSQNLLHQTKTPLLIHRGSR